jgi:hypothetical protein
MSTPSEDQDIGQLVDRAQHTLRQAPPDPGQTPGRRVLSSPVWACGVWLTALALWGWQLWPHEPSEEEVRNELQALITEARGAVERHVAETQALPERLPAATPALVISYEVIDASASPPVYALTGRIGTVSQRWTNAATPKATP